MQYDNYASLLSTIQDAWHGHYSLPHLTQTLTTYHPTIAQLTEPTPSPASRQRVESKQFAIGDAPVDLRDSGAPGSGSEAGGRKTVDYVLHTSQLLNLDEVETVRLIHTAYATAAGTAGQDSGKVQQPLSERIMRLYYGRRYNLYVSVLDLVLMYENPSFPVELLLPIHQFVSALLTSSGLLSHVLSLIAALTTQLLSSSSSSTSAASSLALTSATATSSNLTATALLPHRIQELSHLCSLLLAIARKHPPTAEEGTQLLATLQSLSTLTTQHQHQQHQQHSTLDTTPLAPLTAELDTARRVCYSLLTALLSSLSVKLEAVVESVQSESDVSSFVSSLQAEGDKSWASINFNAAWFMCWSLFLRRLKPILPSLAVDDTAVTNTLLMALSSDVGLIGVVYSEWLSAAHSTAVGRVSSAPVGWERREDVSEVWAELYASLLLHASEEVELMRDEDAKLGDDSNFYYLLLSLSTLCQQSEHNVSLLWSLEPTTPNLIQSCLEQPTKALLSSPLLFALVSLLTSLTLDRSADYGLRVWELLNDSQSLSWHTIFATFDQVARVYLPLPPTALQQTTSQPANVITAGESALLCALLSVLTAALSSLEVQSLLLGSQGAQYKPLDRLFALLGCRVDTVLKSAVLDAINALCTGDRQSCVDVWERMERAGMLARDDRVVAAAGAVAASKSGGGVGVWYDVEEVESVQRRYMLTIAFSRLVLTLLSTTPLPSPSLSHYLTFLTHHLFLSLSDRQYERPIERWKLTEACLAIAALCIESATPTPFQSRDNGHEVDVGLSLVRDLLQGKELLVKLLETLSRAYQLLEAAASTTVAPLPSSAVEAGEHVSVLERGETEVVRYVEGSMVAVLRVLWSVMSGESEWMELLKAEAGVKAAGGRLYSLSSLLFGHGQEVLVIAHATAYVEGGGSVVGRVMSERERRRRRDREEELEAWKGEREEKEKRMADEGTVDDRDADEDEGGYIPYYCTLLLHHLATASPSRLSNLLLASHLAPDISRSLASLLTSTQLPSHTSQLVEASRTHQARIEAVRLLREGVVDGGLGLVLLGFDLGMNGENSNSRLELSDRRFALDAIIELVQKPSFGVHFPELAVECFQLLYLLVSTPHPARSFLPYLASQPLFFLTILRSLPLTPPAQSIAATQLTQQRRFLLSSIAVQLFTASSLSVAAYSPLLSRLLERENDGSLFLLSLLSSFHIPVPSVPTLPSHIGNESLSSTLIPSPSSPAQPLYHLPSLYRLLTVNCQMPPPEAARLCEHARQWNVWAERMSAVRLMGESWRSVLELLSNEWELDGVVEVVDSVLVWLVDERPVYLSLSSSLSALLLSYMSVAATGRVCRVVWSERLVDALVNHQQPMARCNMYAALLEYCHALQSVQDKERVLAALTNQPGRVLSLLMTDVLDGSVAMRAVASSLLSYLLLSSPSSTLLHVRHSSLLSNIVSQLVKRDDDLRLSVLSGRPVYSSAVSQYGSAMALLLQICWVRGGRDTIVDSQVIDSLTRLRLWQLLADLPASASTASVAAYYRMLIPFLRLLVGLLTAVHSGVLATVVEFLRQHRELLGAVVKGGRGQREAEEVAALTLMAQLLQRVEAVSREARKRSRDVTDSDIRRTTTSTLATQQQLVNKQAAVTGVTGHLRGLLKYVGVSLPSASSPATAAAAAATTVTGVSTTAHPSTDVVVSDTTFLHRYHKLLMLQLSAFVQSSADSPTAIDDEQLIAAVLSLACLRLDIPRSSDVLLSSSLDGVRGRGSGGASGDVELAGVDVSVGVLVDVLYELARRVNESTAATAAAAGAEQSSGDSGEWQQRLSARVDRCVYGAEHGLLLLSHHVNVYADAELRRGVMPAVDGGGQWRERAAAVILPLLSEVDRVMGSGGEGKSAMDGVSGVGGGSASTALAVSGFGASDRGVQSVRSVFVAALTRRTRQALQ